VAFRVDLRVAAAEPVLLVLGRFAFARLVANSPGAGGKFRLLRQTHSREISARRPLYFHAPAGLFRERLSTGLTNWKGRLGILGRRREVPWEISSTTIKPIDQLVLANLIFIDHRRLGTTHSATVGMTLT
jgi:hypothetical protein